MAEGRDHEAGRGMPQARLNIRSEDLGAELLLYDEQERRYHLLNSTARLVWQYCDGNHDLEKITALVAEHYPTVPRDRIAQDTSATLQTLADKELIVWMKADAS